LLDHAFARHCKHPFDSTKGCPPLSYFEWFLWHSLQCWDWVKLLYCGIILPGTGYFAIPWVGWQTRPLIRWRKISVRVRTLNDRLSLSNYKTRNFCIGASSAWFIRLRTESKHCDWRSSCEENFQKDVTLWLSDLKIDW
jgi:hypothetical protein